MYMPAIFLFIYWYVSIYSNCEEENSKKTKQSITDQILKQANRKHELYGIVKMSNSIIFYYSSVVFDAIKLIQLPWNYFRLTIIILNTLLC